LSNKVRPSLLPALVLHTTFNASAFLIPTLPSNGAQRPSEVAVGVFMMIAVVLVLCPDRILAKPQRPGNDCLESSRGSFD
jgi:hypothetical protein